ncbi:MAG: hypothetical protein F6K56_37265 [Moorea sp. SIO3G5]|nr:hypothetical protein [Moorena sp. SIO3G5]
MTPCSEVPTPKSLLPLTIDYFGHPTLIGIFLHSRGPEVRSPASQAHAIALT